MQHGCVTNAQPLINILATMEKFKENLSHVGTFKYESEEDIIECLNQ